MKQNVDTEAMMRHLREFERWQKYSGSQEERRSFAYLEGELRGLGFNTRMIEHDAYISLPGTASVEAGGRTLRSITHSFGRATGEAGLTAEVVLAGRGTPAELEAIDCRGKIVVVDGIATPAASAAASRAGALGQIHVSPHQLLHEMCISPVWGNPTPEDMARLPTTVVCTISRSDGENLRQLAAEKQSVTLHASVETGWTRTPILIGDLAAEGGEKGDEPFVLFSGHHDTWYYGVMDNGAANATMLEAARCCALRRDSWRRGLRVAFWSGHSHGRYSGSTWYADNHWDELDRLCVAHVNVDSIGGMNSTVLDNAESMSVLREATAASIGKETGASIVGKRMARAGDQSFGGIGIPATLMGFSQQGEGRDELRLDGRVETMDRRLPVGLGWWWHTPEDTLDKIDPALLERDTRVYVDLLARLLEEPRLPLDFRPFADELVALVDTLESGLLGRFDLSGLKGGASAFSAAATAFAGRDGAPEDANRALMQVSRILVPLEYTEGDRFSHDPALHQPPYPSLKPLRDLANCADADAAKSIAVSARRAANRLTDALARATEILDAA